MFGTNPKNNIDSVLTADGKEVLTGNDHLLTLLFYLLLTVVLSWPLLLHMNNISAGDGYIYVHAFWWFKKALLGLQNPFYTDYVFYPQGANLVFNGGVFSSFLLTLPISLLWGIPEAINCCHLISFTLSGYFTFLLAFELTSSRSGALLAGLLYAFSPYHFGHFPGQLNLTELHWIPLFLLLLKRTLEREQLRWPVLGGVTAAVIMLTDSIQLIIIIIISLLTLPCYLLNERNRVNRLALLRNVAKKIAVMFVAAALLSSGYLWQVFLFLKESGKALIVGAFDHGGANMFSADLADMLIFKRHALVYLGYAALIFSALAVLRKRHNVWVQALMAISLTGLVLSLGPALHLNGQIKNSAGEYVLLPFYYLARLPLFAEVRTPYRFHILTMLGLSLLAGIGFSLILEKLRNPGITKIFVSICLVLVLIEFYPGKKNFEEPTHIPDIYYKIGAEQGAFPILQLPLSKWSALKGTGPGRPYTIQYYQTVHNKKIFGGLVTRTADRNLEFSDPLLETIAAINSHERYSIFEQNRVPTSEEIAEVTGLARSFREASNSIMLSGTKYVVFHYVAARPDSLSRVFIEELLQKKVVDVPKDGIAYIAL